ncbi:hypothetical protein JKP88DRAFT_152856, partial [Tribonema minus]
IALKEAILDALKAMFGVVGSAAYEVDVLSYDTSDGAAILRIASDALVPVRAALTLKGSHGNAPIRFAVLHASPFLAALACPRF